MTAAQAAGRLDRVGPNQLEAAEPVPVWRKLAEQFRDPLVYLLLVAVAVSLVAWLLEGAEDVPFEVVVISLILVANALLGYLQEARAEQAVAALQRMAAVTAGVVRDGRALRLPRGPACHPVGRPGVGGPAHGPSARRRQEALVGRDPGIGVGHSLGQDRHPHPQRDDGDHGGHGAGPGRAGRHRLPTGGRRVDGRTPPG
ncbi:MAG: cation-transporting P-type ATPase [Acidimicrobiales bacterium]